MPEIRAEQLLESIGQLKILIEEQLAEIHDKIEHATEVVRENTEEVGVLRDAIDEFRELYQWALNNSRQESPPPFQLTSMPVDAAASDFAERLNRFTADDLPGEHEPEPSPARQQATLF